MRCRLGRSVCNFGTQPAFTLGIRPASVLCANVRKTAPRWRQRAPRCHDRDPLLGGAPTRVPGVESQEAATPGSGQIRPSTAGPAPAEVPAPPSTTCWRPTSDPHWHRIDADEIWHFHAGAPLELRRAPDARTVPTDALLGTDLLAGQEPLRVPAGWWQAARSTAPGRWSAALCRRRSSPRASSWRHRSSNRAPEPHSRDSAPPARDLRPANHRPWTPPQPARSTYGDEAEVHNAGSGRQAGADAR